MKKVFIIVISTFLLFNCASSLYAENNDLKDAFKPDFFTMPVFSIYGGKPELFSVDLGADFLIPSIIGFPFSYGLYALGGLGSGSEITNVRVSTGLSLQNDYVGVKLGVGGEFSFLSEITHDPLFYTEAILRLWVFEFKVIYDFNADSAYHVPVLFNYLSDGSYKKNPKYYIGVNLTMCLANLLRNAF